MKVQILRDASGKVLASAEVQKGDVVPVAAAAERGHTTEEVEAPAQYLKDLGEFYKTHAKVKSRQATTKKRR